MGKIIYNKGFKDLIIKQTVAPTITFIEKDAFSITVTFTNNSSQEATISYGLSSPPDDDTVLLAASATSDNVVISGLQGDTTYTIFASANGTPANLIESQIVSTAPITTDEDPFALFFDTSGSPGSATPINDLDGNIMADLDKGIAYYGTVSHTDLYTSDELASAVGVTQGTSQNNQEVWHKYYWNGGIHFWRRPIRRGLTWNNIWSAGAIYGTGTTISRKGYTPSTFDGPNLTGINQDAEVTKNGLTYIARLMEGANRETINNTPTTHLRNSEFNLILMNLHAATNSGSYSNSPTDGVSYANWTDAANFTDDDFVGWKTNLGDSDFEIDTANKDKLHQETLSFFSFLQFRLNRAQFNLSQAIGFNTNSDNGSWFPVLTVKHPSFATYGKTGGFNQNEPDW